MDYGSAIRYFISCPDYGRIEIDSRKLKRWTLSCHGLAKAVATLVKSGNKATMVVDRRVWQLGRTEIDGDSYEIIMVRGYNWPDAAATLPLDRYAKTPTVTLTLSGMVSESALSSLVTPLSQVLVIDNGTLLLEQSWLKSCTRKIRRDLTQDENIFRREGDTWRICFEKRSFSIKHSEGMTAIAYLLSRPDQDIPAAELASLGSKAGVDVSGYPDQGISAKEAEEAGLSGSGFGDADPVVDNMTINQCKERIYTIKHELEEARENYDEEKIEKLEAERESVVNYIKTAKGLGGKPRKFGSATEKARKSIANNINRAIESIDKQNPQLAKFLGQSLKTGSVCVYSPSRDIPWKLS